jgi:hypothetical protein
MTGVSLKNMISETQIESRARSMGMDYPENFKVIYDKEVGK